MFIGNSKNLTRRVFKAKGIEIGSPEFTAHWDLGLDIVALQDTDMTAEDLEGDMFNPQVNTDIDPAVLAAERAEWVDDLDTYGVWGLGLVQNGEPLYDTFCWGIEGKGLEEYAEQDPYELLAEMRQRLEAQAAFVPLEKPAEQVAFWKGQGHLIQGLEEALEALEALKQERDSLWAQVHAHPLLAENEELREERDRLLAQLNPGPAEPCIYEGPCLSCGDPNPETEGYCLECADKAGEEEYRKQVESEEAFHRKHGIDA